MDPDSAPDTGQLRLSLKRHRHRIFRKAPLLPPAHFFIGYYKGYRHMSTAVLTWVDPTTRSDPAQTPANPGEIAFINVLMSSDNGQNYTSVGHAAAGQQSFSQTLTDPGVFLFKLEAVDTQSPPTTSADSAVVSVTVPTPALAPLNPPSNVQATLSP